MTVSSIDHGKQCKTAIILPCYNCGLHNFISFQRIKIDNYNCVQKAKCQICKFEWSNFGTCGTKSILLSAVVFIIKEK